MALFGNNNELKIPDGASRDARAYECARIWITSQGQPTFSLDKLKETDDPRAWGSILADLALFAARQHEPSVSVPSCLGDIQKFFNVMVDQWSEQAGKQ